MTEAAVPLRLYPRRKLAFACRTCSRAGQYDKATLVKRVGPDESLVILRLKLARGMGCKIARATLAGEHTSGEVQCGAYYPELR
jgi:hypothetical protein